MQWDYRRPRKCPLRNVMGCPGSSPENSQVLDATTFISPAVDVLYLLRKGLPNPTILNYTFPHLKIGQPQAPKALNHQAQPVAPLSLWQPVGSACSRGSRGLCSGMGLLMPSAYVTYSAIKQHGQGRCATAWAVSCS